MKYLNKCIAFVIATVLTVFISPLSCAAVAYADEPQDVYVYLKVTGNTEGLVLNNTKLWYTIGQIKTALPEPNEYKVTHPDTYTNYIHDYDVEVQKQILTSIERYKYNTSLDLTKADWSTKGLKVDQGATDYVSGGYAWHYDGDIDVKYLTHYFISYIDTDGKQLTDTIEGAGVDGDKVSAEKKTFNGYKFVSSTGGIVLDHTKTNKITLTYKKVPYTITYDWGDFDNAKLPVDNNTYYINDSYKVDTTFTKNTKIYTYNEDGDINGVWQFSGWDSTGGKIVDNLTITGKWVYTNIEVPQKYTIIYQYNGDIPDGLHVPVDETKYLEGEEYILKYPLTNIIHKYDKDGNEIGRYIFSGWDIDSKGVINGNIVATGTWTYVVIEKTDQEKKEVINKVENTQQSQQNDTGKESPKTLDGQAAMIYLCGSLIAIAVMCGGFGIALRLKRKNVI